MSIIKIHKQDRFTTVSNDLANDSNLSFEARGMMLYLLSKPSEWTIRTHDLIQQSQAGKTKVYRILEELENAEYIARWQAKKDGMFAGWESAVFESPSDCQEWKEKNKGVVFHRGNQQADSPEAENLEAGKPEPDHRKRKTWKRENRKRETGTYINKDQFNTDLKKTEERKKDQDPEKPTSFFEENPEQGEVSTSVKKKPIVEPKTIEPEDQDLPPPSPPPQRSLGAKVMGRYNDRRPKAWAECEMMTTLREKKLFDLIRDMGGQADKFKQCFDRALDYANQDEWARGQNFTIDNLLNNLVAWAEKAKPKQPSQPSRKPPRTPEEQEALRLSILDAAKRKAAAEEDWNDRTFPDRSDPLRGRKIATAWYRMKPEQKEDIYRDYGKRLEFRVKSEANTNENINTDSRAAS